MNDSIYDARPTNFVARIGLKFLEALDLSNNLVKMTKALKGVPNGAISLLIGVGAFLALIGFGSLAYYFDINSTYTAMGPLREKVVAVAAGLAGAAFFGWLIQFVPTAITVLPTVSEMLGARFARFNIPAFQAATWMFIFWDLATDIPRVNENINPYYSAFVQGTDATGLFGILLTFNLRIIGGYISFYVAWLLALLGASYFLELITVLLLWSFVALMWKSLGYWVARFVAGRKGRFSGDLGGEHDPDYEGDEVHSAEAASFGGTGRAPRQRRSEPRGRRSQRGPAGGRGRQPVYADDLDEEDIDLDDLEDLINEMGGRGAREVGPRARARA